MFGRRLWLPEINAANPMRSQCAERTAIKLAMIAIHQSLKSMESHIVMQMHGELVREVPYEELVEIEIELPRLMCNVAELAADVGVG